MINISNMNFKKSTEETAEINQNTNDTNVDHTRSLIEKWMKMANILTTEHDKTNKKLIFKC